MPPPTLSPLCSLFSPTPSQTQAFSLYLWRAPLGKWLPLNKSLHNVRLEVICPALSLSLHLSLSLFPLLLLTCLLSTSLHFAQHFSLLTFFPPFLSLSQWVGTQFLITMGDWVYKEEEEKEEGGRERAREGKLEICAMNCKRRREREFELFSPADT